MLLTRIISSTFLTICGRKNKKPAGLRSQTIRFTASPVTAVSWIGTWCASGGYGEAMCCGCCEERCTSVSGGRRSRNSWLCILLLLWVLWGRARPECPDNCQCVPDTATVHCSDAGLQEIPDGIPPETIALHLDHNYIRNIPESAFSDLVHLQDLYLSHNRIDSLSSGALRHLGPELRLLDLSHNQLRQASREDFGATRAKTRLYHNPWHCDCALQELMETLNLEPETVNGIICESSVRGMGEGSRWEELGSHSEHAGKVLVKLLDSGVNFCSLQRKTTDVAMLVTMFVWFFMVIVYVVYYVRQNQAEARRHLEYLKSLPSPHKTPTETDTLSTGF
ncbi:leucine-rich repeat-containing protein 3-like [Thalassophryne amazonica]|uniref:leucine-rich repeat-containing protein 3-like n=1 Tax=Thalassophryne amazonica TaxID=390379 RepID=UPI0014726484|nr:leucine-rich repeat-containing protein 3-like [Thalassophryne amazonica]